MQTYRYFLIAVLSFLFSNSLLMCQETVFTADSSVTYNYSSPTDSVQSVKEINTTLDSMGLRKTKNRFVWDELSGNWVNDYRDRWNYYPGNTGANYLKEVWDNQQNSWVPIYKTDYSWDEEERATETKSWVWDSDRGDWDGIYWSLDDYDADGNQTVWERYTWDDNNLTWKGESKREKEYDLANREVLYRWYKWEDPSIWIEDSYERYEYELNAEGWAITRFVIPKLYDIPTRKFDYTYNEQGDLALTIESSLVAEPDSFQPFKKTEYERSYELPGTRVERTDWLWSEEWVPAEREFTEHDTLGNLLLLEEYRWDDYSGSWYGRNIKRTYSFDESGNNIELAYYNWDAQLGEWKGTSRFYNFFNEENLGQRMETSIWNSDSADWELARVTLFRYLDAGFLAERAEYIYHTETDSLSIYRKTFRYNLGYAAVTYDSICEGEVYEWRGLTLDEEGYWHEDYISINGADSTISLHLVVNPNPDSFTITGIENDGPVCQGQLVFYVVPEDPDLEYSWFPDHGTIISGTSGDTLEMYWTDEGEAEVMCQAINEYGCSSDTAILFQLIHPQPQPFTFSGVFEVVQSQEALYIAPPDPELEYRWAVENGTVVSGALNDTLVVRWEVLGNGGVASWALNGYGCSSDTTSLDVLIGPNGVGDLSAAGILFYPVPVKDILYIRTDLDDPDLLQIGVTDLSGREMAVVRGTSIDLSNLKPGTYVVRLNDREGSLIGTRKIMKD